MLCHYYPPHNGGVEIVVWNLARRLATRHELTIITSDSDGVRGVSEEDGMVVHRVPALHSAESIGIPYPLPIGPGMRDARRAIATSDLLHAHGSLYLGSIEAARVARRRRVPLVVTEHVGFVRYSNPAFNAVESAAWATIGSRVMAATSGVATINSRIHRWLAERYPESNIRFIANGVDTSRFCPRPAGEREEIRRSLGLPTDVPLMLFVGRDSEKKNFDGVLGLPRDRFHLVVCGAKRDLVGERLTDLGIVPYDVMPRLFASVDAMVLASTGEGFPLVVQEALASGVPTALLWDPGYAASLDRDVVAACDSTTELAETVARLAQDAALRERLSSAGRAWAEQHWSWDATVRAYEQLYSDVMTQPSRRT
jgi:D-inositol-3-phosphate glycosyltransferase